MLELGHDDVPVVRVVVELLDERGNNAEDDKVGDAGDVWGRQVSQATSSTTGHDGPGTTEAGGMDESLQDSLSLWTQVNQMLRQPQTRLRIVYTRTKTAAPTAPAGSCPGIARTVARPSSTTTATRRTRSKHGETRGGGGGGGGGGGAVVDIDHGGGDDQNKGKKVALDSSL